MSLSQFDVAGFRSEFPFLRRENAPVYLDSAATSLKPQCVIDAVRHYYELGTANVRRGAYPLSELVSGQFEQVRSEVADYLGGVPPEEVFFAFSATDGLNLLAGGYPLGPGDEVIISAMDHHAAIVPWQLWAERRGAKVVVLPVTEDGELNYEELPRLVTEATKVVVVVHVSNVLGTCNDIARVHRQVGGGGPVIIVDGAQSFGAGPVDVVALGCDAYVGSGHKSYGPTGCGVVWGKSSLLERLLPMRVGGGMIEQVSFSGTTFQGVPHRFEAGTPAIEAVIGLGAALGFIRRTIDGAAREYKARLLVAAADLLGQFPNVRVLGRPERRDSVISFTVAGAHPHDLGSLLGEEGICVRVGHHCCEPLMAFFGIPGCVRLSLAPFNTSDDLERLGVALERACRVLGVPLHRHRRGVAA